MLDDAISKAYSFSAAGRVREGVARERAVKIGVPWWWAGLEWQGQLGGCVNWTVRRRLSARVAAVGAMRTVGTIAKADEGVRGQVHHTSILPVAT